MLRDNSEVIAVLGYFISFIEAFSNIVKMAHKLLPQCVNLRFAIHRVTGKLSICLNMLLDEARKGYSFLFARGEIDSTLSRTDVVFVIGATNIVNPTALEGPGSLLARIPVLHVWKTQTALILKRDIAAGDVGVGDSRPYKENTRMLFHDTKQSVDALLRQLEAYGFSK